MDGARVEFSAGAGAMTGCVQVPGDVADTHGPRRAGPGERELEHGANDIGLDGIDGQLALRCSTDRVGFDGSVSERNRPSVGVAAPGGRGHSAHRADARIVGFPLVGKPENQPGSLVADVFGKRTDADAMGGELADGDLLFEEIPECAGDRVHEHGIDRVGAVLASCEHLLQFGSIERARTLAGITIDADDDQSLAFAVVTQLEFLLLEREPVFGLLVGRDADIEYHAIGSRSERSDVASAARHEILPVPAAS
ncbi:hypothetical protein SAMN05428997_104100 [Bosea sp. CRIB-10]|nr:hypothetical protein SAMN05428997_104100 [Bosea sp. CRIB-10]